MPTNDVAGKPGLDPTMPDVRLTLGGVEYQLCYDFNAIAQAERVTGVNLLMAELRGCSANQLRGLLWAAVLPANPDVSLDGIGALIRPRDLGVIHAALIAAWYGSVADPAGTDGDALEGEAKAQPKSRKAKG